jgi:hypothetical protein
MYRAIVRLSVASGPLWEDRETARRRRKAAGPHSRESAGLGRRFLVLAPPARPRPRTATTSAIFFPQFEQRMRLPTASSVADDPHRRARAPGSAIRRAPQAAAADRWRRMRTTTRREGGCGGSRRLSRLR